MQKLKVRSRKDTGHIARNSPDHQVLNKVVELFSEERYMEAQGMEKAMTDRFPQFGFGWSVLGAVLMKMGQFPDALVPMQKAAVFSPDNHHVHNSLGANRTSMKEITLTLSYPCCQKLVLKQRT